MYRSIASKIMKTTANAILLVLLVIVACTSSNKPELTYDELKRANEKKAELIEAYEQYYDAVENALDTLEHYDNWVDRFDFEDYYYAIERIDSIYATEL